MNENHRRVLTVYLCVIEKSIINIQNELHSAANRPAPHFCSVKNDVGEKTKAGLLSGSSEMLEEIGKIKQKYELSAQTESSKNRIKSELTEIWSTINDLRPQILENYGSLTEEDKIMFDSLVSTLLTLLDNMSSSFDDAGDRTD
ncbi:MAG: hypothetical protein ABR986_09955 [Methanomassiliicoccales archaeon]|jgi:polyribonucleotide nucleotidyltransferase